MKSGSNNSHSQRALLLLTLGALGVVYGDIGTSPLYALKECFSGHHAIPLTEGNVLGVLSLIVWSLIIIVSIKYAAIVLRADNRGEGGGLALMALVLPQRGAYTKDYRKYLEYLGLFGAALLYGDGMITPAISVLSAVEGLKVATDLFEPYIVGITVTILFGIFLIQYKGTAGVGKVFGPVILLWFSTLFILGIAGIFDNPSVLRAVNPWYGVSFFFNAGSVGLFVLGSVFLAVTGAEALYADMGHFGRTPIRIGWFGFVLWALLANYFGQGALLISGTDPEAVNNPFYHLAPTWLVLPLVALATAATVIASQALISGAFSLTRQAVQLGYLPRLQIIHTSEQQIGQIYIPIINTVLLISTVLLVVIFKSSTNLASAYGVAVSTAMIITTILTFFVAVDRWRWSIAVATSVFGSLLVIDLVFLFATLTKIFQGGWVPLAMGAIVFTLMATWRAGRMILADKLRALTPPFRQFLVDIKRDNSIRVPGTAVFMTRNIERTPPALIHNVRHNKVIHKTVVLLMVVTEEVPYLADQERLQLENLGDGFYSVTLHFGFAESPDVPKYLEQIKQEGVELDMAQITYFLGRETVLPTDAPGMAIWREKLFALMSQNAQRATAFYQIPPEQVIEIGFQVEL